MMHTNFNFLALDQNVANVRALRSLRAGDAGVVAEVIDAFRGDWSVQASDDYDGYLFLLIEPSAEHAEKRAAYIVSGKSGQIELATIDGDDFQTLGHFGDIYGLTAELTSRLLSFAGNAG